MISPKAANSSIVCVVTFGVSVTISGPSEICTNKYRVLGEQSWVIDVIGYCKRFDTR